MIIFVSTKTTENMKLQELVNQAKLEKALPNSREFNMQRAQKHNAEVDAMSEKIYNAYLPKGESVARERQELYKKSNYRTASFYNKCLLK